MGCQREEGARKGRIAQENLWRETDTEENSKILGAGEKHKQSRQSQKHQTPPGALAFTARANERGQLCGQESKLLTQRGLPVFSEILISNPIAGQ